MTTRIQYSAAGFIDPILITGYESRRRSRNVIHEILDSNVPVVTIRPAALRTGTLTLLFPDMATAHGATNALGQGTVFTLYDLDFPGDSGVHMRFVISGDITLALDEETRVNYTVSIDYSEVK